jgi:molecular chaperone GrpE
MSDENSQIPNDDANQSGNDASAQNNGEVEHSAESLHLLLEDARSKADEHWDQVVRLQAELENVRRRATKDVESAHKFGLDRFVNALLPVIDSLELGLDASKNTAEDGLHKLQEGTEMTLKMFTGALEKFNVQAVGNVGDKFSPEFHQAITVQESNDFEPNSLMLVMQKGYVMNERLIRPAMVVVSKAPADKPDSPSIDVQA